MMHALLRSSHLAVRRFRRHPWESLFAVVALALGLGAVAACWAVVDTVLLKSLPGNEENRLVALVQTRIDDGSQYTVAYHNADRWRRAESLDSLKVSRSANWALLSADGMPRRLKGYEVEPGFFELLGLAPRLGRRFEKDTVMAVGPVIISDHLWRTELGADPGAVGRTIRFAEGARIVVGVMPPLPHLHQLALAGDLWAPLRVDLAAAESKPLRGLRVLARLDGDANHEVAQAELDTLAAALAAERPETNEGWGVTVEPMAPFVVGGFRGPLLSLLAVATLVLLVSVATVGSLGVAHGLDRRGEMAIRRALGADGKGLATSWLVEWALTGFLGGLLGLPSAGLTLNLVTRYAADRVPLLDETTLDGGVCLLVLGAAVVTGVMAGLLGLPSLLAASRDPRVPTWDGRTITSGPAGTRTALVAVQTCLTVVALVAALLLARSLTALGEVDLGFEPEGLVTFQLELPLDRTSASKEERRELWRRLLACLESVPGVERAAVTTSAPLSGYAGVFEVWVEGDRATARSATPEIRALAQIGSPGLLDAAGIQLVAGRTFAAEETWDDHHAVLVNRAFSREHLTPPGGGMTGVLGRRLRWQNDEVGEIVGVVGDVREVALHLEAEPEIYMAWGAVSGRQTVLLRVEADVLPQVRRVVADVLPGVPIHGVATGEQLIAGELAPRRLLASLSGVFATLAQLLALLGLYGVVTGRLARAKRDVAVRMALGARATDIRRWALWLGLTPVALGACAGLALAWTASGLLSDQLFGVGALDPLSYLAAVALVVAGSAAVTLLPARRATRLDPARTLRETG